MTTRGRISEWLWPRDRRSTAEIEAEVREELEGHVARMVDEQLRAGVPADEARRQAAARFGDVDRYAEACREIALGERLLVRRALSAACLALAATTGYLAWRVWKSQRDVHELRRRLAAAEAKVESPRGQAPTDDEAVGAWVERIRGLRDHMHTAFAVGAELTLLEPELGLEIVEQAWPKVEVFEVKTGLLKAFAFSKALRPHKHPRLFAVLHLGMTDDDPAVREYAASYLEEYAGAKCHDDAAAYETWHREHGHLTPAEALQRGLVHDPRS